MPLKSRKPNGHGHTYRYRNSYRTVIQHNGHKVTASAKTAQESRRLANEKVLALPTSKQGLILRKNKTKLSEFLSDWLENEHKNHIAHSTYLRYRSLTTHHINPLIGEHLLQDLTPRVITWFLNEMKSKGQGARSQQQARALLSICLGSAEEQELIENNPVRKVRNPQNRTAPINPLSIDEVRRLLKAYKGTYLCARLHIALLGGLRQGEALGLCWEQIDFERSTLRVEKQVQKIDGKFVFTNLKTERSFRTIVLSRETIDALLAHKLILKKMRVLAGANWSDLNLVFPNATGEFRSPKTDFDEWLKALKLCSIPRRRLHDARHTAATLMYSQSIGVETISRALGHSSSAITSKLYVHSAEEPLRVAAEALNLLVRY